MAILFQCNLEYMQMIIEYVGKTIDTCKGTYDIITKDEFIEKLYFNLSLPIYSPSVPTIIHKNKDRVWNRWLVFNPDTKEVKYSNEFVFFKDSYFEFVCSLVHFKGRIFVSIGVNDNKAFIIELDINIVKHYCNL